MNWYSGISDPDSRADDDYLMALWPPMLAAFLFSGINLPRTVERSLYAGADAGDHARQILFTGPTELPQAARF